MKFRNHVYLMAMGTMLTIAPAVAYAQATIVKKGQYNLVVQMEGATLGYCPASGVKLLTVNELKFKDLNRNGKLDKYEDWRLSFEERAVDLASQLSDEEIAGLMLYSAHQQIPARQ